MSVSSQGGSPSTEKEYAVDNSIIAGALLTVSVLITQSYFSLSPHSLDLYQKCSLFSFAIAIPGLSFWYYISKKSEEFELPNNYSTYIASIFLLSALAALVGIGLAIWRYFYPAGIAFFCDYSHFTIFLLFDRHT